MSKKKLTLQKPHTGSAAQKMAAPEPQYRLQPTFIAQAVHWICKNWSSLK